jgi:hypothetical protein
MRRALAGLAALCALAAAAPAAQADHIAPTVTATLDPGARVKGCDPRSGLCGGARRAAISWNASCGPAAPSDALQSIDVTIFGVTPSGGRFAYDSEGLESEASLVDSLGMTVGPGLRFIGEVVVTCAVTVTDEEGTSVEHRGQATATTAEFYLPPFLTGWRTTRSGFCGVNPPNSKLDKLLQAGQYAELAWLVRFSGGSLLRRGVPALRQIKLFARGAGIRLKASPFRPLVRQFGLLGTYLTPRRGGTLRIWATIGGKKTNALTVRVLPKRC